MDKRVMKTRRAIHSAMTRLLAEKPIEEITVTELSEKAEINRKTFYSYYSNVYMVAEEMEDEIVERFEETLRGSTSRSFCRIRRRLLTRWPG